MTLHSTKALKFLKLFDSILGNTLPDTNTARMSQATRMLISRNRKTGAGSRQEMLHYINNSIDRNGLESRFISSFKGKLNFKIFDHLHWILNDLDECIVLRVVDLFSMLKC